MAEHNKDREIDELLDSLLSEYSSVEPRPGLETRILANIRDAEESTSRRWKMQWFWAGAAVAAVLIAVLIAGRHRLVPRQENVIVHTQPPQPPTPQLQPERQPIGPEKVGRPVPRRIGPSVAPPLQNAALPLSQRPQVFPTPVALSEQERLLFWYIAGTPHQELIAQSHPDDPPVISPDQSQAIPDLSHIPQAVSNTR